MDASLSSISDLLTKDGRRRSRQKNNESHYTDLLISIVTKNGLLTANEITKAVNDYFIKRPSFLHAKEISVNKVSSLLKRAGYVYKRVKTISQVRNSS
jgi:phosphoribosyl-dephospho-CoA transferase